LPNRFVKTRRTLILPAAMVLAILWLIQILLGSVYLDQILGSLLLVWTPFSAVVLNRQSSPKWPWTSITLLLLALTLLGNGFTACGIFSAPNPQGMMMLFSVEESAALGLMKSCGFLGIALAICLFFPILRRWALFGAAGWGTLVVAGSITAHFQVHFFMYWAQAWLHHAVYEIPISGIAFILLIVYKHGEANHLQKVPHISDQEGISSPHGGATSG